MKLYDKYSIARNRLKELRLQREIGSQREFAEIINKKYGEKTMSHGFVNKIENATGNPTWNMIRILCDYFHVTPRYLLGIMDTEEEIIDREIERVLLGLFDHGDTGYIRDEIKDEVKGYIQDCCGENWSDVDVRTAVTSAIMKRFRKES